MKKLKNDFFIVLFNDEKYQKSARRTHAVLLPNHRGVHELVAGSSAWQVRAAQNKAKIGSFAAPHDFSYTTRANISHEEAEQIRARIACTPAYIGVAGVGKDWALPEN